VVVVFVFVDHFFDLDSLIFKLLDEVILDVFVLVIPLQVVTGWLELVLELLHNLSKYTLVFVIIYFRDNVILKVYDLTNTVLL
jgi:hypothetical protein